MLTSDEHRRLGLLISDESLRRELVRRIAALGPKGRTQLLNWLESLAPAILTNVVGLAKTDPTFLDTFLAAFSGPVSAVGLSDLVYTTNSRNPQARRDPSGNLDGLYRDALLAGGFSQPASIRCARCSNRIQGSYFKRKSPGGREISLCQGCNSIVQFRLETFQRKPHPQARAAADQALSDLQEARRLDPDDETIAKNFRQARMLRSRARGSPILYTGFFIPVCAVMCFFGLLARGFLPLVVAVGSLFSFCSGTYLWSSGNLWGVLLGFGVPAAAVYWGVPWLKKNWKDIVGLD